MKAVIAVPPVRDFYFTPSRASALGAASLQAELADCGIKADIFNFPVTGGKAGRLSLPGELDYLKPHLIPTETGPLSVFISCFAWAYASETIDLAAELKKLNPGIHIAAGGAGVTVNPEWFRASGVIDSVLPGRAEEVLPDFLGRNAFPNVSRATSPAAPRFLFSETGFSASKNTRFISCMLTRGCPKACRFCANHLVHGRKFRKTPLKELESGIKLVPQGTKVHIDFEDDNLLCDAEYFLSVLKIMKKRFPDSSFSAENGLDYTYLAPPLIKKLVQLGFRSFNLSMASSSRTLLSNENRPSAGRKLDSAAAAAAEAGIPSTVYFICGLEGDTAASTLDNLLKLHSLPCLSGISMFYPVPGLPGFPPGMLSSLPPRLCAGSSAHPWMSLSTGQLITAFRLSRLSNLIKTVEQRIPEADGRPLRREMTDELLSAIRRTGRLHSFSGKTLIEVPLQDEEIVSGFLTAASID